MSDYKGKHGGNGSEKRDWAREAMLRRRADRWRGFAAGIPPGFTAEVIWAAQVWSTCPVLQTYLNCAGRYALCGGGGDDENLADEGPTGLMPQAMAHARAADAIPQPGQVAVYATTLGSLRPDELVAYARAAEEGLPWGTDLVTGKKAAHGRSLDRLCGMPT